MNRRQKVRVVCDRIPGTSLRSGDTTTINTDIARHWRRMGWVRFVGCNGYRTATMPPYDKAVGGYAG